MTRNLRDEISDHLRLAFPRERRFNAILQHEAGRKIFDLEKVFSRTVESGLRHEADDLATHDGDAVTLSLAPDSFKGMMKRGLLVINQIHRDLRDAPRFELETESLQVAQTAVAPANAARNLPRDRNVVRLQVDVVSDEEGASADDYCPGALVHARVADVRRSVEQSVRDLLAQLLEPTASDLLKVHAVGPQGRALVKVNGNPKFTPDSLPSLVRERDAILNRHPAHGDEGQHIGRADARVLSLVPAQVNQLRGEPDRAKRSLDDHVSLGHKRDDRAVVVRIRVQVEHDRADDFFDGPRQPLDYFRPAAFAKIWHALDETIHPHPLFRLQTIND